MERKAWFCPSCNKHHAPHVETCPGPVDAIGTLRMPYFGPNSNNHPGYDPCANCKGACGNTACARRMRLAGAAYTIASALS